MKLYIYTLLTYIHTIHYRAIVIQLITCVIICLVEAWNKACLLRLVRDVYSIRWPDHQGNPHIRESRILAPVRPRMQAAGLRCLKLQIAVASPDPQTCTFPGKELSRRIQVSQ